MDDPRTFTDKKGRVWHPTMDCRVLALFEKATGKGVLQEVFEAVAEQDGDKPDLELASRKVFQLGARIIGHIGNLMFLLYEGCRPHPTGAPIAFVPEHPEQSGESVVFDDFCAAVDGSCINEAMLAGTLAILDFFPEPESEEEGGPLAAGGGRKGKPGRGKPSTS